ncbi:MAG: serine/threonine-protein kinase, partial [Myxococcota bacterium]
HFFAANIYFVVWALCRRPRSYRFVLVTEAIGTVLGAAGYVAMGLSIPAFANPMLIVALVITWNFFARSVFVPSPARRTALLGLAIAVVYLPGVFVMFRFGKTTPALVRLSLEDGHTFAGITAVDDAAVEIFARSLTVEALFWWTFSVIVATVASHVFYGLRRQASKVVKLGQYQLERKLGEGGMGVVYLASHAMLRRPAAVKMLPPEKLGARSLKRFEREVQRTASLAHPNVITVFDYGRTPDDLFYYAMEYVEGATLEDVVRVGGPQPASRVVYVLEHVSAALAEAHGVGLIHRDVKPANVMLARVPGTPDVPKVLDFGLVKDVEDDAAPEVSATGEITGTPQYMAPEAITGASVDGRSDLYALGAVGYFLLTGTHLFEARTVVEVCSHHLHSAPEPPSERLGAPVHAGLEALLLACLAKDPKDRPATALTLQDAITALEVPRWTRQDAERWWHSNATALDALDVSEAVSGPAATLAIDVEGRAAGG